MTSMEFTEWLAFWETDPPPDVKRQLENANLACTIAQVNSTKSGQFKPKDFLIDYTKGKIPKIAKTQDVITKLNAWRAGLEARTK